MTTIILGIENARARMAAAWSEACRYLEAGKPVRLTLDEAKPSRTLDQNAKMWATLTDIARQVQWPVDGKLQYLEPEDWKDILTAGLRKEQRVAQGMSGGFVMLGQRTSKMRVGEMMELIELALAFGAEHDVRWGDERRAA